MTPTSRSTASAAPTCAASSTSRPTSAPATARRRRSSRSARPAASGPGCCGPRATSPRPSASPAPSRPRPTRRSATRPRPPNVYGRGSVEVPTFDTARAETEHVADLLRRAHLEDGVGWGDMAVLVRSGRASIPALRRSLSAAGVPVEVAGDETPLVREPAVAPLLAALGVLVDAGVDDPADEDYVGADRVEGLLTSALGGLDATDVRALTRALRARTPEARPRDLVRAAVLDPALLDGVVGRAGAAGAAAGDAAARGRRRPRRRRHRRGGALDDLGGLRLGPAAARRDPRSAARPPASPTATSTRSARSSRPRPGPRSSAATPASQRSSPPCAPRRSRPTPSPTAGVRGEAVRLLTAHRSKGLEWRLVVVAHVQDGAVARPAPARLPARRRPDRRRRPAAAGDPPGDARRGAPAVLRRRHAGPPAPGRHRGRLARRRRRAAVAVPRRARPHPGAPGRTAARGRSRWPVWSPSCAGSWPTRPRPSRCGPRRRRGCVAWPRPRCTATGSRPRPTRPPGGGCASRRRSDRPVRPDDEPLTLSASALEGLLTCPAQWFLTREAGRRGRQLDQPGLRQDRARHRRAHRQRRARSRDRSRA